jgi:HEPN domain-containing protein
MNSKSEIKKIALQKLKDAELLYNNVCYDNAYYLAGYSVELSLKARICKNLGIDSLFTNTKYVKFFKVHDFDTLLMFSGLLEKFENDKASNIDLHTNWSYICQWKEDCRYHKRGEKTQLEVQQFINAINDPVNGFLKWIKKYW